MMRQPLTERYRERLAGALSCYDRIIVTGTLPGACYCEGRLAPDCRHAFAGRAAWLAGGCLVLRWVGGRGRPGRRLHEIGHGRRFRSSSITNCRSAGCSRSASTGPLLSSGGRQVLAGFRADRGNAAASIGYFLVRCPRGERWTDDDFQCRKVGAPQPPVTVIIGGRALLMLIAARFSGPGSGEDLLRRALSLILSGLLPFSSFPTPVAPDSYRGRDRPACRIPCARRGMAHRVRPQ